MPRFSDPEPLVKHHERAGFDCGVASLNEWLFTHAPGAGGVATARTYVVLDSQQDDRVVGYHALTAASITHEAATGRVRKGMPWYPIPAVLLSRLAVELITEGQGLGAFLLKDAMLRAFAASEEIGARLLLVHALDEKAAAFYRHFGFEPSASDRLNLQLLMKDIKASLDA